MEKDYSTSGLTDEHTLPLDTIYQNNWFKLFIPESLGGAGFTLPQALRLEEQLARTDGSLGWTVTLCAGASLFCGYLDPKFLQSIISDKKLCFAGSGKADGTAVRTSEGYLVNGKWKYATGALHASIFTANCIVKDTSEVLSFCFKKDEVVISKTWNAMGLKATGSHQFEVKDLCVPEERTFRIDAGSAKIDDPIYTYPFNSFAECTLAVNTLGMGLSFLDECQNMGTDDESRIEQLKTEFYSITDNSWTECVNNRKLSDETQKQVRQVSQQVTRTVLRTVHDLYPYCGMKAADTSTRINRIWRDLHTASQHSLLL